MSTRTEELKKAAEKGRQICVRGTYDEGHSMLLDLIVELHERIDELDERLKAVERDRVSPYNACNVG